MAAAIVQHVETAVNAASATLTVAAPAANNLLVAWANSDNTVATPTGWTGWSAGPSVVDGDAVYLWYKVAAGTEGTSVTFTPLASDLIHCGIVEFSGVVSVTPFDKQGSATVSGVGGTSSPTLTAIVNTGANGDLVVAVAGMHTAATTVASAPSWASTALTNITLTSNGLANATDVVSSFVGWTNQSVAGSITTTCSWTTTLQDRQILIISFALASAAAAASPPPSSSLLAPGTPSRTRLFRPVESFEFTGIPSTAVGVSGTVVVAAPPGQADVTIPGITAAVTVVAPAAGVDLGAVPVAFANLLAPRVGPFRPTVTLGDTTVATGTVAWITGVTLGSAVNSFTAGWIGVQLVVGASPVTVVALGRWVISGNSHTHQLHLTDSAGTEITGTLVTLDTSTATPGQFAYVTLTSPVTLSAGTTYYLGSHEASGLDFAYDWPTAITAYNPVITPGGPFYSSGAAWTPQGGAATTANIFGPLNLLLPGAGVADFSAAGAVAGIVVAAPPGQVDVTLPGATTDIVVAAPTGAASVSITGAVAGIVVAAPAGSVAVTLPGTTGTVVVAAPAGSVSVGIPGVTATIFLAAPAGGVDVTVPGVTAPVVVAAPAGGVDLGYTPVAFVNRLAPRVGPFRPTVTVGYDQVSTDVAIPGAVATVVLVAPTGATSVTIPGPTATVALVSNPGTVAVGIPGVTATVVVVAPTGAVGVAVPGPLAQLTVGAPTGRVDVAVAGLVAAIVLAAAAGSVTTGGQPLRLTAATAATARQIPATGAGQRPSTQGPTGTLTAGTTAGTGRGSTSRRTGGPT